MKPLADFSFHLVLLSGACALAVACNKSPESKPEKIQAESKKEEGIRIIKETVEPISDRVARAKRLTLPGSSTRVTTFFAICDELQQTDRKDFGYKSRCDIPGVVATVLYDEKGKEEVSQVAIENSRRSYQGLFKPTGTLSAHGEPELVFMKIVHFVE